MLISDTMTAVLGGSQGADAIAEGIMSGEIDKPARILFQKALLSFLGDKVKPTPEQTEAIANGDTEVLLELISQSIGIHAAVIRGLIALILQDNARLVASVGELAGVVGLDP